MKKTLLFLLTGTAAFAQSVDVHRNLAARGTVLGAVAGAIIGNNSGNHNGAQGAVIGAAAGAMLGAAADQSQPAYASSSPARYYRPAGPRFADPVFYGGYSRGYRRGSGAYYGAMWSPRSDYYYYQSSPEVRYATPQENAVTGGAFLGALAGAVIGNNSGHGNGGRGALIGAGIGALLGALSEPEPRYESRPVRDAAGTDYVSRVARPPQATVINNYYVSAAPTTGGYRMDAPADGR